MKFVKMHGLGNDFIILDHFFNAPNLNYPALAPGLCDRHFGIGADGIIAILPSRIADARMRIFNPDGSEAEMCGNGIRCVARYIYEHGYVQSNPLRIETLAGVLPLHLHIADGKVTGIKVDMGEPVLKAGMIPVLAHGEPVLGQTLAVLGQDFQFTAVSMGNPHCIIFVNEFAGLDFMKIGPAIETHSLFPKKTNVEFIRVESPGEITMKVWERGAGPTLACGTGACAAAVAAVLNGKTEREITVHLPGGDLLIEWGKDNHVYMTGPALYSFRGEWLGD